MFAYIYKKLNSSYEIFIYPFIMYSTDKLYKH